MKKSGASHAFRIVGISFLISVLLSAVVIFVANDVFAFVAESGERTVVIPENATTAQVSSILGKNGLIRFPLVYRFYAYMRSWNENYLAGEFELDAAMSYDELRYALTPKKGVRSQIKVTIPEGYTTDEIISLFVSLGIGSPEGFADVIENGGSFGYDFVSIFRRIRDGHIGWTAICFRTLILSMPIPAKPRLLQSCSPISEESSTSACGRTPRRTAIRSMRLCGSLPSLKARPISEAICRGSPRFSGTDWRTAGILSLKAMRP